ncbi:MAG TPA: hypothetical protein VJH06_01780 [Candidatus Paceibacterota bacterium]
MEQNFQTSFIPKKPMVPERAQSSRPIGLLFVLSLLILFAVIVATGSLYFYKSALQKNISGMEETLNLAKYRFEPARIAELQVLDKRLRASNEILSKHMAITPVFEALEKITLKTVRYTKFSYDLASDNGSTVDIKMSGQAIGYRSVALQADLFTKNKNLIDPVFSNLTLDNSGNVLFDLEFSVEPSFINYKQTLLADSADSVENTTVPN